MSKVAVGYFPEKISYVMSEEREESVGCAWDISWYDSPDDDSPKNVKAKVYPSWPVATGDDETLKKAIPWAERGHYDHIAKVHVTYKHSIDEVENKPFTGVKVLSLEERGNGGRAYKVTINDKYYVDLREDVMMDTILRVGISPGGILNGEFIWAKLGRDMKLVRVGSELHRLVEEYDSKKDMKAVSKKALEVGGVYQDRKKNKAIFLGFVNLTKYKPEKYPDYYERKNQKPTFTYEHVFQKKAMLFYTIWDVDGIDKTVSMLKSTEERDYHYRIVTSHKYIEKIKDVKIPDDIIQHVREKHIKEVKSCLLKYTGHIKPEHKYYDPPDAWYLTQNVSGNSEFLNIYPFESEPVELFDIKKFLLFS